MASSQQRLCTRLGALALSASTRPRQPQLQATQAAIRSLSTTPPLCYKQVRVPNSDLAIPSSNTASADIPPYPYGERQVYKQSNHGLYGSARIRFGNIVSEKWSVKTRRKWRPNVHSRRLWSESLGMLVRTRVTTRVLRTIDKVGGLDAYLLGVKTQRVKDLGPWGWRLRWRVMQTPAVQEKFARERAALGLPPRTGGEESAELFENLVPEGADVQQMEALIQSRLENEEEFELGPPQEEEPEQGFMREEPKSSLGR